MVDREREAIVRIRFAKMPPHASTAKEDAASVVPPVVAMEEPEVMSRDLSSNGNYIVVLWVL